MRQPEGQCRPQYPDWPRANGPRFLSLQKQPYPADLGDLQPAIPCGDVQYSKSRQFWASDAWRQQRRHLRRQRKQKYHSRSIKKDDNTRAPDSVRLEGHILRVEYITSVTFPVITGRERRIGRR